jgi:cytochrome oxidase Cu insertion factor (SCO1/SenC/PrrC family)
LVAVVLLTIAGCGGESRTTPPPATTAESGESQSSVAGTTLDGERVSLDQFRGRPVLVNVWSSW